MNTKLGTSEACQQKNISCSQIKTADGFNFQLDCPEGSEITVSNNTKTVIGHVKLGVFNHTDDVIKMTINSVTTGECKDLTVKCSMLDVQGKAHDKCLLYKVTVDVEGRVSLGVGAKFGISIGTIAIIIIIIIAIIFFLFYNSWKKKM